MTIQLNAGIGSSSALGVRRRLVLIWREPSTRRFARVARLDVLEGGGYRFEYEPSADGLDGLPRLDEYPAGHPLRIVEALPAFFRNRVMSSERASYSQYLTWLGLDGANLSEADLPLELLVRSGGGRVTDTFHVVEAPVMQGGVFVTRFFVSGISHVEGAAAVLASLSPGDLLALRSEPENPTNPLAVALDSERGGQLGWVPDWLCAEVQQLEVNDFLLSASVERINLDAPAHVRVLCRVEGRQAVDGGISQGSVGL